MEFQTDANDSTFNEKVIEKSKKVLVIADFWAEWCMPCLMLSPILDGIAEEYKGEIFLVKCNIDENQTNSEKYNVSSIPSVKLFKNGKVVDEFVGVIPEHKIKEFINKNLK
jgi:putative thioredoxin